MHQETEDRLVFSFFLTGSTSFWVLSTLQLILKTWHTKLENGESRELLGYQKLLELNNSHLDDS